MIKQNPLFPLRSRDVDQFMLMFHDIEEKDQKGYIQRLKNITRMGVPTGVGAGRGHPAQYDLEQLFQLLSVTMLYRCHLTPLYAVQLMQSSWDRMIASLDDQWKFVISRNTDEPFLAERSFWSISTDWGLKHTRDVSENLNDDSLQVILSSQLGDLMRNEDKRSFILVDVRKVAERTASILTSEEFRVFRES